MAATRTKRSSNGSKRKPPPKRARRSLLASRPSAVRWRRDSSSSPTTSTSLGLALIAVGVFLAGVGYLHWGGGALGDGAMTACRFLFGALGYAVPVALVLAGALVLMRELRPPARPMRTGVICLTAAITLALAAGTLGLGPGPAHARVFWNAHVFEARGGVLGEAEFWVASHLISTVGADILAVFMFLAGCILVSGATLAA